MISGRGVRTELYSGNSYLNLESHEDDGTQTNSDATVRPVTLPEGWTVVLNSLQQVVYCHVKSGIACFQMPENPELLDDLKFENGASSGSGNFEPETSYRLQAQTWQSSRAQQVED